MTKDYAKHHNKPKKTGSYLVLWLFVVCLFVVFVGVLLYLGKNNRRINPTIEPESKAEPKTKSITPPVKSPPPTENIVKEPTSPKFEFYTMLPQKKNGGSIAEYELEIATVKDYAVADHLKAKLALLGFAVSITPLHENGLQKYCITIGPYDDKDGATADLERLKQNKINSKLKKIR
jgi:cell division protein FtsN